MHPPSSSTFSSKPAGLPTRSQKLRSAAVTVAWTVLFLALADVAINWLCAFPADPRNISPTFLQRYFEYGRSGEGKIRRMIGSTDETTAPIALLGWVGSSVRGPAEPAPGSDLLVAVYGMSFAENLAQALKQADPTITLRSVMGPGATLNHSYASYQADRGQHKAKVAILGFMAANIPMITTMSAMTWVDDASYPYTYPRYKVQDGKLVAIWPPIRTLEQMRTAILHDPALWDQHCAALQANDPFYDGWMIRSFGDRSSLVRLLRRGWGQGRAQALTSRVHTPAGFDLNSEEVQVTRALVADFAASCRQDGVLPVVFLVHNQGYGDHLYVALRPTLEAGAIPYLSSHDYISASDARNFLTDGHFTAAEDALLGREMLKLINSKLPRHQAASTTQAGVVP